MGGAGSHLCKQLLLSSPFAPLMWKLSLHGDPLILKTTALGSFLIHEYRSGSSPADQGSRAHTRVALQPCAELACLRVCLLLQPRVS